MSKILYINNNNFHHLGRPQMCAGAWCLFGISKSHSERLWAVIMCYHWRKSAEHSATRGLPSEILPARTRWYASTYDEGELNFAIHMAQ